MLPIAKEFQLLILVLILVLLVIQVWFQFYAALPWLFLLAFIYLVRDFHRSVPPIPLATISPVDGNITAIHNLEDPFLNRPSVCYTIAQSALGEFNIHSPTEGKLEQLWVRDPVDDSKAFAFWVKTDEDDDVIVHIDLSSIFQHGSTALHPGERVGQGYRCGFAAPGCTVRVYLPEHMQQVGKIGDKVNAGRSVIANFIH